MRNDVAPRWPLWVTLLASMLLHIGGVAFVGTALTVPRLEVEFQLPIDVEFGMTDQIAAAPVLPGETSALPSEDETTVSSPASQPTPKPPKPKKPPKPAQDKPPQPATSAAAENAGTATKAELPAGTQIAVRVDLSRIRKSPIAEDVGMLLAAVPDWNALLDGSGIDPIADLDRLMIATPNLQRSKIIVAGRYVGDEQKVFDAVKRLAEAHDQNAPWRSQDGVRVAKWANLDETPRVIALVGPTHFTISREEDLARVLAVAVARADARKREKGAQETGELPADALLSMEPDEGLSVEVEGAERFVRRGSPGIPTRLRLSAVEVPGPRLELRGQLFFADEIKAQEGARFWEHLRDGYAANALVSMLGLAQPLKEGRVQQQGPQVTLTVTLSVEQARLILGYLRELVRPPPPAPATQATLPGVR